MCPEFEFDRQIHWLLQGVSEFAGDPPWAGYFRRVIWPGRTGSNGVGRMRATTVKAFETRRVPLNLTAATTSMGGDMNCVKLRLGPIFEVSPKPRCRSNPDSDGRLDLFPAANDLWALMAFSRIFELVLF